MKPQPRYDICEARAQIEQGKTIYRKRKEVMERVDDPTAWGDYRMQGTGKFELVEVTRAEYYA